MCTTRSRLLLLSRCKTWRCHLLPLTDFALPNRWLFMTVKKRSDVRRWWTVVEIVIGFHATLEIQHTYSVGYPPTFTIGERTCLHFDFAKACRYQCVLFNLAMLQWSDWYMCRTLLWSHAWRRRTMIPLRRSHGVYLYRYLYALPYLQTSPRWILKHVKLTILPNLIVIQKKKKKISRCMHAVPLYRR